MSETPPVRKSAKNDLASESISKSEEGDSSSQSQIAEDAQTTVKPVGLGDILKVILDSLAADADQSVGRNRDGLITKYLHQIIAESPGIDAYNVLIIHDNHKLLSGDADKIYEAITKFAERKPILLVLFTPGGEIPPAYFIGKLCREFATDKFVIAVPRRAKSAGTLICCAADEIHMGSMSELGPIDPQIDSLPALGLKSSIEHIAELVKAHPESSKMFAEFLSRSLNLEHLGYYERVAESAVQYAVRLLEPHSQSLESEPIRIASILVYTYKDHGFVIDRAEASKIFGADTVKANTPEYHFGNKIYSFMDFVQFFANNAGHKFYFVGSVESKGNFMKSNNAS